MDQVSFPPPPRPDKSVVGRFFGPVWAVFAVLGAWIVGQKIAVTRLGFVPKSSTVFLLFGVIPLAVAAILCRRIGDDRRRRIAVATLTSVALVTPIVGTIFIPALDQLPRTPLPGDPTLVFSASPDGNANLYVLRHGGAQILKLTNTAASELMPDLSPDGSQVVYVSDAGGTRDLHVMRLNNLDQPTSDTQITHDASAEQEPRWSPDGSKIVFSVQTVSGVDIALIDADGTHLRYLTTDHTSMNPSWSPDGRSISFTRPAPEPPADDDIWVMRSNGTHARDVVHTPGPQWGASWSPDGRWFVFTGTPAGNEDVMIAQVDGNGIRDITDGSPDRDEAMGWTSDGHVMFLSDRAHTGGTFLYFMNPDGSGVHLSVIL